MLSPEEISAITLSCQVALLATLIGAVPAVALGWLLGRWKSPLAVCLEGLVMMPLVLPPVVTGTLLLWVFGRHGPMGRVLEQTLGVFLPFSMAGAVLAGVVMALPLFVRAVRLSVESVDEELEQAARTLGASPFTVAWRITLPLAMPGVVTGALLGFARSLGEFGATITFAGNVAGETRTLPLALFSLLQVPDGEGAAMRLVVVAVLLSMTALFCSEFVSRWVARRVGRRS